MPELTPNRLLAIEELGQMDLAELNHDSAQVSFWAASVTVAMR